MKIPPSNVDHFYRNESDDHPYHAMNRYHDTCNPRTRGLPVEENPVPVRLIAMTHATYLYQGYGVAVGIHILAHFSKNGGMVAKRTAKVVAEALRHAGVVVTYIDETEGSIK